MHHITMRRLALIVTLTVLGAIPLTVLNHRYAWHDVQYRKAERDRDWPEAARRAMAMYRLRPDTQKIAAANSALAWLRAGQPRKAIDILEKELGEYGIRSTSGSTRLRGICAALHAWALFEMDRGSETAPYIERARKFCPNETISSYVAGRVHLERGEPLKAAPFYKELAERKYYEKPYEAYRQMLKDKVLTVPEDQLAGVPEQAAPVVIAPPTNDAVNRPRPANAKP